MSEKEREHVDLPPLTFLPLLFIKTLKFLEQLRTIISRDGEIATEERSNLCRQHFSTAKKIRGDPLVTREKFLPVSGDESEKEGERERILFYFHYLFYLVDFYLQPCLLEIGNCWILTFQSNM